MALRFPSELPPEKLHKPPFDHEAMFTGLLMGFAVVAFATCFLFVMNGKAEQWLGSFTKGPAPLEAAK